MIILTNALTTWIHAHLTRSSPLGEYEIRVMEPKGDETCPICLGPLTEDRYAHIGDDMNDCGRQFCAGCFQGWIWFGKDTCPTCRGAIDECRVSRQFTLEFWREVEDEVDKMVGPIVVGIVNQDFSEFVNQEEERLGEIVSHVWRLVGDSFQQHQEHNFLWIVRTNEDIYGQVISCFVGINGKPPTKLAELFRSTARIKLNIRNYDLVFGIGNLRCWFIVISTIQELFFVMLNWIG